MNNENIMLLRGVPKGDDGKPLVSSEPATTDELKKVWEMLGSKDEKPSLMVLDALTNVKRVY